MPSLQTRRANQNAEQPIWDALRRPFLYMGVLLQANQTLRAFPYSPRVYGHAFKYLFSGPPHNDEIADVVLVGELLEAGDEFVDEGDVPKLVHRCVYGLSNVILFLGLV